MSVIGQAAYLIVCWRGKHLLNKEVVLHENLLRLLELGVESWRDVNLWLRPPLGLALTVIVATSLEAIVLLLIRTFLIINLINIWVALLAVGGSFGALSAATSYIALLI